MSHYRNLGGGKRDSNEPEIMKRFRAHGWHPEQVSGNRQWDLNAYPPNQPSTRVTGALTLVAHVDVKGPTGKVEEAQVKKWSELAAKGIPVYVVRTNEDVDALVVGTLEAWKPEMAKPMARKDVKRSVQALCGGGCGRMFWTKAKGVVKTTVLCASCKAVPNHTHPPLGMAVPNRGQDRKKPCGCLRSLGRCEHGPAYSPPRSEPVDAAKVAEETFAPTEPHGGSP